MPGVDLVAVAVDDAGTERRCRPGEEGELRAKGPQVMLGYVDAALDAEAFDAEGYYRTGDLGIIDAEGYVVITGRLKDIIIRNGAAGAEPTVESLGAHLREVRLRTQALPERVELVDALPRNPAGKVLKRELQDRFG